MNSWMLITLKNKNMEAKDYSKMPDISPIGHPFAKPCMMTIFMHDYATPPSSRNEVFPFVYMEGKSKTPIPLQIFNLVTMEMVRTCSDEQLGKIVRIVLNKLDGLKNKIEQP